jgi:hypothetical protein
VVGGVRNASRIGRREMGSAARLPGKRQIHAIIPCSIRRRANHPCRHFTFVLIVWLSLCLTAVSAWAQVAADVESPAERAAHIGRLTAESEAAKAEAIAWGRRSQWWLWHAGRTCGGEEYRDGRAVYEAIADGVRSCAQPAMTAFSGWGPTDDGRIKPDVVANGIGVYSARSRRSVRPWPKTNRFFSRRMRPPPSP